MGSDPILKSTSSLFIDLYHMVIDWQNGTVDDVKKIVATLNAGDIPSTDVVGKYICYRIHQGHNIWPLDRMIILYRNVL